MNRVALLDLSFDPALDQVSTTRHFVEAYCAPLVEDVDLLGRVAMATHELLENAAKYSSRGLVRLQLDLSREAEGQTLSVSVSNCPSVEHLAVLETNFRAMSVDNDPHLAYQALLIASTIRTDGSGLGLARIRSEGDMAISLVAKDGFATITASARSVDSDRPSPR